MTVSCNAATPQDTLAVFISHQGRPHAYQLIHCQANKPQQFTVLSRKLPAGVLQISLLNRAGNTLCDRFIFASPRAPLQISPKGLKRDLRSLCSHPLRTAVEQRHRRTDTRQIISQYP